MLKRTFLLSVCVCCLLLMGGVSFAESFSGGESSAMLTQASLINFVNAANDKVRSVLGLEEAEVEPEVEPEVEIKPYTLDPTTKIIPMDGITDVEIGNGTVVKGDGYIFGGTKIGENTVIEENVGIQENVTIGDNVYIGYDVRIMSDVEIGDDVYITSGARIYDGAVIHSGTRIDGIDPIIEPGEEVSGDICRCGRES